PGASCVPFSMARLVRRLTVRCDFADLLLHSYFDSELSSVDAEEFGRHVERCADCGSELVNLDLLRDRLQLAEIYEAAPASLRRKISAEIRPKEIGRASCRERVEISVVDVSVKKKKKTRESRKMK